MPRVSYRDPYEERRKILFGDEKRQANITAMSKGTGIAKSTLYRCRRYPHTISLENLIKIVRWNRLSDEEMVKVLK